MTNQLKSLPGRSRPSQYPHHLHHRFGPGHTISQNYSAGVSAAYPADASLIFIIELLDLEKRATH